MSAEQDTEWGYFKRPYVAGEHVEHARCEHGMPADVWCPRCKQGDPKCQHGIHRNRGACGFCLVKGDPKCAAHGHREGEDARLDAYGGGHQSTWARYLDVLGAEYEQADRELKVAKEWEAKAEYRAEGGDHSDIEQAVGRVERATRLRNIAWTMFVQARALLSFGLETKQ